MTFPPEPWPTGNAETIAPLVRRVLAGNPSPFTFTGTQTYLVGGAGGVVVVDPGPAEPEHLSALVAAIAGAVVAPAAAAAVADAASCCYCRDTNQPSSGIGSQ